MNYTKSERPFSSIRAQMSRGNHFDEDDAMADTDYARFLESARAVKDSYVSENVTVVRNYYELDVVTMVREIITIVYEVEELSNDKLKRIPKVSKDVSLGGNVKSRKGVNEDETETARSLMSVSRKRKRLLLPDEEVVEEVTAIQCVNSAVDARRREGFGMGNCYTTNLRSDSLHEVEGSLGLQGSGPNSCRKSADCGRRVSSKVPSTARSKSEFDFVDRSYKFFLDKAELVDESLVLKTNDGEMLEFEKEGSTDSSPSDGAGSGSCKRKSSMSHQQGKKKATGLHHVPGGSSNKRRKVYREGQNYRFKLRSNILNNEEGPFPAKKKKENSSQHITHRTSGFSLEESNLEVHRSSSPKSKGRNHIECETVEQDFKLFLGGAKLRDGLLVSKIDDMEEIVLEEDSDSSSMIVSDNADALTDGKSCPFVITKEHYSLKNSMQNSDFRRMLIETLHKPYDSKEHRKLLREASKRTPVVHHRELRSRTKDYPVVELLGKSYFDHHQGLEDMIDSANDHRKVLNLLRGFFYWLKNVTKQGSFKPWTDKACLQIMPRS